jgi:TRAP-type C4-dicarboxylate transport system permease small subunit
VEQASSPAAGAGGSGSARQPLLPPDPPAPWPIAALGRAVDWSVLVIGAVMASLVFANVIVHNVFNGDIAWTTEFCELLMVWVTFLGGAAATRRGAHMVINELVNHLQAAQKRYAEAAIQVVVFVTLGLLAWYGVGIAEAGNLSTLTVLGWPMSTQYVALPVTALITMVFVGWDLVEILRGKSSEERHGVAHP